MTDNLDEAFVAKQARALSARMRRDPDCRRTVSMILHHEGFDELHQLATAKPDVVTGLVEMFEEMDLDDQAMDDWAAAWKPESLTEKGLI